MLQYIKNIIIRIYSLISSSPLNRNNIILQAMEYDRIVANIRATTPGNVALHGYKVYAQNDEDGIIDHIFTKVKHHGTFLEIGIQDGTECNTLNLVLQGWRGVWIEGDSGYFNKIKTSLGSDRFDSRFRVVNSFIDTQNIITQYTDATKLLNVKDIDFFSLDIDGNDYHVAEALLMKDHRPTVFCVEYNGKFPPPLRVNTRYDAKHIWDKTEYQGASLQSFTDLFQRYGYTLLTCNVVGINAFYIRNEFVSAFTTYPIEKTFQPCRYHLSPIVMGHPASLRFMKEKLSGGN